MKIPERRQWRCSGVLSINFGQTPHYSGISSVEFEKVNAGWVGVW